MKLNSILAAALAVGGLLASGAASAETWQELCKRRPQACVGKKAPPPAAAAGQSTPPPVAKESPTQRCTREAKARGLDGVARRAFMKGCTKT